MLFLRDFAVLCVVVVIFTFGQECTSQVCDIDFHTQSASVMLLEGENASVVCDATCYRNQGDVEVVWMNARASQIGFFPGSVFSVRYNRGLMNRLMVIGARTDTAGVYVCSVKRDGQIVQQKPMEIVVLGNSVDIRVQTADTGPRRGDMIPERELEYRPVRSVERALSRLHSQLLSRISGVVQKTILTPGAVNGGHGIDVAGASHFRADNSISVLQRLLPKQNQGQNHIIDNLPKDRSESAGRHDTFNNQLLSQESGIKAHGQKDFVSSPAGKLSRVSSVLLGRLDSDVYKIKQNSASRFVNSNKTESTGLSNKIYDVDGRGDSYVAPTGGLSRVKRQMDESTTETFYEIATDYSQETTEVDDTETTSGETVTETTDTTPVNDIQTVHGNEGHVTDNSKHSDHTTETTAREDVSKRDIQDDLSTTPCSRQEDTSTFGKHGVLAFSITLAVSALLVYTILMIIFMPRIMAKRKDKQVIEGSAYRKTGLESSNMAPMTILDIADVQDSDPVQEKLDTSDLDQSGSVSDKSDSEKKDEDLKENPTCVSTFLLRQESQRKTEEETQAVRDGKETALDGGEEKLTPPETPTDSSLPADSNPKAPEV